MDQFRAYISYDEDIAKLHHYKCLDPTPIVKVGLYRFATSNFLRTKLSGYKEVINRGMVWFVEDTVVKLYYSRVMFDKAVKVQRALFEADPTICCELLDVWDNGYEWFTVSRNGGKSFNECIDTLDWKDIEKYMEQADQRLKELGWKQKDCYEGNYVLDAAGQCRVIDYETVVELNVK